MTATGVFITAAFFIAITAIVIGAIFERLGDLIFVGLGILAMSVLIAPMVSMFL